MFNSAILDVAIGIAFVYLFLSLVCSVVNEGIAALFSMRSKNLAAGINSLFSESRLASGKSFVQAIYEHGLVRGLFQDPPSAKDPATGQTQSTMILPSVLETAKGRFHVNLPSYIPARAFSSALVGVLLPSTNGEPQGLAELRDKIVGLPESPTKEALLSLVAATGKDIEEFQQKAEKWFDDGMDRVAGWYKRRTQKFLVAIGFAVAIILNVDTIKLAQELWNNPVERQAAVELAQKYVDQNKEGLKDTAALQEKAQDLANLGKEIPFPFGWHLSKKQSNASTKDQVSKAEGQSSSDSQSQEQEKREPWGWLITLIGWIITALALSLGAPFWFDTLNKFMVVRSTVKPQEKSPPEGSKD
jgi:hypothetical protein